MGPHIDRLLAPRGSRTIPSALICFSHLRWNFVWQRPQHLLTRFARHLPVFLIEEPEVGPAGSSAHPRVIDRDGVTVITPVFPATTRPAAGFGPETNECVSRLLTPFFASRGFLGPSAWPILWYYTPMALGAEPAGLTPALVVADVMDELANFLGAPPDLKRREAALLARANLVFAGGPSLYASRRERHPAVYCFPSGVEPAHFAQAAGGAQLPPELATLPRPVLGFYGVLDERLDLTLIDALAHARPDWTLLLIGPIVKIDPRALPRRANIVYLGIRSYHQLPAYLAGFDVALLPFARNDATRFISPTKTLEYLAGRKPVVSTPIQDVIDLYGDVVSIASTPAGFIAAVEAALQESPAARRQRLLSAQTLLATHNWDAIAARMWSLLTAAWQERQSALRSPRPPSALIPHAPPVAAPVGLMTTD